MYNPILEITALKFPSRNIMGLTNPEKPVQKRKLLICSNLCQFYIKSKLENYNNIKNLAIYEWQLFENASPYKNV